MVTDTGFEPATSVVRTALYQAELIRPTSDALASAVHARPMFQAERAREDSRASPAAIAFATKPLRRRVAIAGVMLDVARGSG